MLGTVTFAGTRPKPIARPVDGIYWVKVAKLRSLPEGSKTTRTWEEPETEWTLVEVWSIEGSTITGVMMMGDELPHDDIFDGSSIYEMFDVAIELGPQILPPSETGGEPK